MIRKRLSKTAFVFLFINCLLIAAVVKLYSFQFWGKADEKQTAPAGRKLVENAPRASESKG